MSETDDPIRGCIERWHRHMRGELAGGLDALLHEDCVFLSPIVFTPQRGRELTKLYLRAAGGTLADAPVDAPSAAGQASAPRDEGGWTGDGGSGDDGRFRYTKQILAGHHAMLEFETTVDVDGDGDGKYVNGVDIITCDDDGTIVEFKVMIRPLQAINAVHQQMQAMLQRLAG